MLRLASDGIFSFSDKPVSFILGAGAALAALGALWLLILLFVALAGHGNGLSALAALMVLLCGVIVLSLGVLGAYIARTYDETLGRPLYIVSERHGFPKKANNSTNNNKLFVFSPVYPLISRVPCGTMAVLL